MGAAGGGSIAQQGHEILRAPLHVGLAAGGVKAVGLGFGDAFARGVGGLVQHHLPFAVDGKVHGAAGREAQRIANRLGDGDLAFDGECGRQGAKPPLNVLPNSKQVIPENKLGSTRKVSGSMPRPGPIR